MWEEDVVAYFKMLPLLQLYVNWRPSPTTPNRLVEIEPDTSELPLHQTARSNVYHFTVNAYNYWLILRGDKVKLL